MTQHDSDREGPSPRTRTGASMTTEYQERFLHPRRLAAAPKAPSNDATRSRHVTTRRIKNPPPASAAPKHPWRCGSAAHNRLQVEVKVENFTSVYQNDFPTWKTNKRRPFKMTDNLRVSQGLVVPGGATFQNGSVRVREPQPFESITSYRLDYVRHPVQPRTGRRKATFQPGTGPSEPVASWNARQELVDEADEVVQTFKTWSLEAKTNGQVHTKGSGLPTEPRFLSTTTRQCTKPVKDRTRTHSEAWNRPRHTQNEPPRGTRGSTVLDHLSQTEEPPVDHQTAAD